MNVGFFITYIGDVLKLRMARDSILLLEELGCRVNFPEKQGCCGQSAINSGYIKEAVPKMKSLTAMLEDSDDPTISPAGSYTYAVKSYPTYLTDGPGWTLRAEKASTRMQDLTSSIISKLGVVDVGTSLQGRAVYYPSCSLTRRLGVKGEPLTLLRNVRRLELLTFASQDTCCGFGGTFSVEMTEISGEMMEEKVLHLMDAGPEYLIGADVSCLPNIGDQLQWKGQPVRVIYIAEVLMSR